LRELEKKLHQPVGLSIMFGKSLSLCGQREYVDVASYREVVTSFVEDLWSKLRKKDMYELL